MIGFQRFDLNLLPGTDSPYSGFGTRKRGNSNDPFLNTGTAEKFILPLP
jgi:hypothetical protein